MTHLDHPAVQGGQDPWPLRMEAEAFDAVALGFKLRQLHIENGKN